MTIDWRELGFSYVKTNGYVAAQWKDGHWSSPRFFDGDQVSLSVGATALHYGQSAFEGMKAFSAPDGKLQTFRKDQNLLRLNRSASYLLMPEVSTELFDECLNLVVSRNKEFIPPHNSEGALYIRPLLFGSGAQMGVKPAPEYTLLMMVFPVGSYYKNGVESVPAIILEGFDRAAPMGMGHIKAAGNYAASLTPSKKALEQGFKINLYLDAREEKYIDEFGTSNFIAITKDGTYVTPRSPSILPSITNASLIKIAEAKGFKVERRPISVEELSEFSECGACGTAVVITPISAIHYKDRVFNTGPKDGFGPKLKSLYEELVGIQRGTLPDQYGWMSPVKFL